MLQEQLCLIYACADLEEGSGGGGGGPPRNFEKFNIADIMGNEKISYFSYLLYVKGGPPPPEKFSGSAPDVCIQNNRIKSH